MAVYLAVDLGTTGLRSVLFDTNGKALAYSYEEYELITPKENYVEQNAELWWKLTLKTAKAAISDAGISAGEIKSISISSQGITVVPVDESIKPLYNAINWLDMRAEDEVCAIERDFGKNKIFEITGKPINEAYTLPKLLWLKNNEPEIYEKAYKFLMPMDFLVARFTGKCVTDCSMASGTLMYDLKNQQWCDEILDFYKIDKNKLPTLSQSGEAAEKVLPGAAKSLGLNPECVVGVGAQDQKCAAFGAGLEDGIMTVSLGTAAAVTKLWNEAKTNINTGVGWCGYINCETFVTEGVINTAGTCLRWVRDMFFKGEDYDTINREAEKALLNKSSLMFHPYMSGSSAPDFYPESTGNFYGVNLATKRGDFALAVMEGVAFQLRRLLEAMDAFDNVHTLILFGGGAKSDLWCRIIADVTGMKIKVPENAEAAAVGAARLAGLAVGHSIPPLECDKTYVPGDMKEEYDKKYKAYRNLEKSLWGEMRESN